MKSAVHDNYQVSEVVVAVRISTPVTQCRFVTVFSSNVLLLSSLYYRKVHPCSRKVSSKSRSEGTYQVKGDNSSQ